MANIAQFDVTRYDFRPGDRVLIRTPLPLPLAQRLKIERWVEKWAGCSLNILFVARSELEINVDRPWPVAADAAPPA